ncbi:MAG: (2Fe-2S)-binding protein [Jhaorihella sp.]
MAYQLSVNGQVHEFDLAHADTPLVFVLRETLGLTGTKYSCLQGLCGACTVHLDGSPARACQLTVEDVAGMDITTIEGLSEDGSHPVQKAWLEGQVAQCGWCQPGQIMQAAGFLNEVPRPDLSEIKTAMDGNICRCGAGPRIINAVARAAEIAQEADQ